MEECCCTEMLFDGSCLGGTNNAILASCSSALNATHAQCRWGATQESVLCLLGQCLEQEEPFVVPFLHQPSLLFKVGLGLVFATYLHGLIILSKKEFHSWKDKYEVIQPREFRRIFQEVGFSLMILGVALDHETQWYHLFLIASIRWLLKLVFLMSTISYLMEKIGDDEDDIEAINIYQNFQAPLSRILVTFCAQVSLACMYLYYTGDPNPLEPNFYIYYFIGVVVQMGYNRSKPELREGNLKFWVSCFAYMSNDTKIPRGIKVLVMLRWLFVSFFINNVISELVIMLLPIYSTGSASPRDFALGAVTAYYITDIDQSDPRKINSWEEEFNALYSKSEVVSEETTKLNTSKPKYHGYMTVHGDDA